MFFCGLIASGSEPCNMYLCLFNIYSQALFSVAPFEIYIDHREVMHLPIIISKHASGRTHSIEYGFRRGGAVEVRS